MSSPRILPVVEKNELYMGTHFGQILYYRFEFHDSAAGPSWHVLSECSRLWNWMHRVHRIFIDVLSLNDMAIGDHLSQLTLNE